MNAYELMLDTNYFLIKGGRLSESESADIVNQLLAEKQKAPSVQSFDSKRHMSPIFFIPPDNNGKKLKTLLNQTPKTRILSDNAYELEILRLLCLLSPDNSDVTDMVSTTLARLKTTCFGYSDDGVGECFDTSLVVLRFLATAVPQDKEWIYSRIENFNLHFGEKKRTSFPLWYYWLCLSELPADISVPEILKYKEQIANLLGRSYVMNTESERIIHPVCVCILKNALTVLPEFDYIKERQPYTSDKDGRLYFDMRI